MVVTLFLCGDVMTGRGVDQILAHANYPRLFEPYVQDAREYCAMAESVNGRIPRFVSPSYVWGDALQELARVQPAARIVNLETSVTRCEDYWQGKGIHYRMHPENVAGLTAAQIDVCALANNHVLNYGRRGDTLDRLAHAGLKTAGQAGTRSRPGSRRLSSWRPARGSLCSRWGPRAAAFQRTGVPESTSQAWLGCQTCHQGPLRTSRHGSKP